MLADKLTELSRIKLKTWTRQPVPMISEHSAHLTPLTVDYDKPISSIPLFSPFSIIIKRNVNHWISHSYLSGVVAAQLRWNPSNMNVIKGILQVILLDRKFCWGKINKQGAVSIRKTVLPGMAIPILKIRRPNGRLIFNMEIAIRR